MIIEEQKSIDSLNLAEAQTGHQVYLLLDGARFDDIYAFIYQTEDEPEYIPLFEGTYFESVLEGSPCLIRLKDTNSSFFTWFCHEKDYAKKGLLIVSALDIKKLAKHFKQFFEAQMPDGDVVFFRYYDPSVFHFMAPLSTNPEMSALLKPCDSIYWYSGKACFHLSQRTPKPLS